MAAEQAAEAQRFAENGLRHVDMLAAMGMYGAFRRCWHQKQDRMGRLSVRRGAG